MKRLAVPSWLVAVVSAAATVGVVFGLQAARSLLVPLLLALFLAILASTPVRWLRSVHVPEWIAVALVVLGIFGVVLLVAGLVGTSIAELTRRIPQYQDRLRSDFASVEQRLTEAGMSSGEILDMVDPSAALGLAGNVLTGVTGVFGGGFLIFFALVFMLLEASRFPDKLYYAFRGSEETLAHFGRLSWVLNRYLGLKTLTSALTGVAIFLFLSIIGLDFALLWATVAFLFNYIPNIGSVIASVPAVLIAYLQLGPATAIGVAVGYLAVNVSVGNLLEPRVMGEGMGLSTLVVFLSLLFWGFVFGPVGMLLSVPLTMSVKLALESADATRDWATLLAAKAPSSTGASGTRGDGPTPP
ncbi:MAG: AI-2E family transporter [Acidobacteriota bacterium]|nr:AI-2E family transporter [Acidobacteriota bacterium]